MSTKVRIVLAVLLSLLILACSSGSGRLEKLSLLDEAYPRAFFFRLPENAYEPYAEWEANNSQLMGILGKCMPEELIERTRNSLEFFNRFKQIHPGQAVLLHFDGLARDPYFKAAKGEFFAGHWLYHNGAKILSDVPAESGTTSIQVSDASLFMIDIGIRNKYKNDDIGLCELDDRGMPNWQESEQVRLVSVNLEDGLIEVERGLYGTTPRSFSAEKSYAAAHCTGGPWGENLLWFYNYSTESPRDASGRSCTDVLLDDLSFRFSSEGELAAFDGVEFDIIYFDPLHLLRGHPENPRRGPDVNADGQADNGVINGIQTYGIGTNSFLTRLRERLGDDRLIMADGGYSHDQRSFGILNGIESEGWPNGGDFNIEDWSGGMNRHFFWYERSRPPRLNFINHRYRRAFDYSQVGAHQARLVMAASVLTDSAYALADLPSRVLGYEPESADALEEYRWDYRGKYPIWDELVMGEGNRLGWLGRPLSPPLSLAETEVPVLGAASASQFRYLMGSLSGPAEFTLDGESLKVSAADSSSESLSLTLREVSSYGPDLTVRLEVRGEAMQDYPTNVGRLMHVSLPRSTQGMNRFMSWFDDEKFRSSFYFSYAPFLAGSPDIPVEVDLVLEFEGSEALWISEIQVYSHPDTMVREFEHGIVLANPSPRPCTFDLAELFPEQKFRRIQGTTEQDPLTNDGSLVVESRVRLVGKDALFLIKED